MKLVVLYPLVLLSLSAFAAPEDDFVIEVSLRPAMNNTFVIRPHPDVGFYNYNVDCDDDGTDEGTSIDAGFTCEYVSAGTYTVRISDNEGDGTGYTGILFDEFGGSNNFENVLQVADLIQWGNSQWTTMAFSFAGASLMLVSASDVPDMSTVEDMRFMFYSAQLADPDTTLWDVSSVVDMSNMFALTHNANPNTSDWNVSNVIRMFRMFRASRSANPDVSDWIVSSVENFSGMFDASRVAQPNTTQWDVSAAKEMKRMFASSELADPDTSNWVTSAVEDMSFMFASSRVANPNTLNWDVSSVENFEFMFDQASKADPDTSLWVLSSAKNMNRMFSRTPQANPDVSHWDVSMVTDMSGMFQSALKATPDVSEWTTSSLLMAANMFSDTRRAKPDMRAWNILSLNNATGILSGVKLPIELYDEMLIFWSQQQAQMGVSFSGGQSNYCNSEAARLVLENNYGWTIVDGGLSCDFGLIFENDFEALN